MNKKHVVINLGTIFRGDVGRQAQVTVHRLVLEHRRSEMKKGTPGTVMNRVWENTWRMTPEKVEEMLHMFFSPLLVPKGLTKEEVLVLAAFCLLQEAVKSFFVETRAGRKALDFPNIRGKKRLTKMEKVRYTKLFNLGHIEFDGRHIPSELLGIRGKKITRRKVAEGLLRLLEMKHLVPMMVTKGVPFA